jgi:SAM-dependent methyltransferase
LTGHASFDVIKRGWIGIDGSQFFAYYKCPACGTLNTREYPSESAISELYASMPPNMAEVVAESDQLLNQRSYAKTASKLFADAPPDSLNILELGADCGLLCRAMADLLPHRIASFQAIEPNKDVHADLQTVFQETHIKGSIHPTLEDAMTATNTSLDLVIAIHVFDHIFDLQDLFSKLRSRLSKAGHIFFVVHNPHSTLARVLGKKWPPYCAQHPQLFTPSGVRELAKAHSLRLRKTSRTFNHFSLGMVSSFMGLKLPPSIRDTHIVAPLGNRYYILEAV